MNTKMMEQFSVMDNEMLACIEGGDINENIGHYDPSNTLPNPYPFPLKNMGPFPVSGYCPRGYHDIGYIGAGFHLCKMG
ncbi:bacteriocin class II family protein [Streptococcus mitis]|uniref:bacteriocin class II family protein n=1 Tax=Streptococcus mitis TaxID=28037 RepID=UPI0019339BA4